MERTKIDPERIDDVVFAQGYANGEAPAIGALVVRSRPACRSTVPGYQLDRRCGSGLQAVVDAAMMVQTRRCRCRRRRRRREHDQCRILHHRRRAAARAMGGVTLHDRLTRGRVMSPADRALRRHHRHDRDRREPRPATIRSRREACDAYAVRAATSAPPPRGRTASSTTNSSRSPSRRSKGDPIDLRA